MMTYLDLEVTILVEGQEYAVQVTVEIIEEGESDTMIEGDFFPRLNLLENEGGLYSVNGKHLPGRPLVTTVTNKKNGKYIIGVVRYGGLSKHGMKMGKRH